MQDIYYFCIHIIIYISMKLSNKTIISIFIALTYIINLFAQGYESELTSKHLSASDGLLSNTIRAMVQDNTGYIWIGTTAGLTRYDGYSFVNFKDATSSSNYIGVLTYDSKNNLLWTFSPSYNVKCLDLNKGYYVDYTTRNDGDKSFRKHILTPNGMWLYTEQFGIRHVVYNNGEFKTTDYNTTNHNIPENKVSYMVEDNKGNVWAIASHHVMKIDKHGKLSIINKTAKPIDLRSEGDNIIIFDANNNVWNYTASGKLKHRAKLPIMLGNVAQITTSMIWQGSYYIFTSNETYAYNLTTKQWSKPQDIQIPRGLDQGHTDNYHFVANNKDGNLWMFPKQGKHKKLHVMNNLSADPGREHIYNITTVSDSLLAIATYGEGLIIYNPKTGNMVRHTAQDKEPLFLSNYLFYIIKDQDNGIWLAADAAGVSYISPKPKAIARYAIPCIEKPGSRDNGILRIKQLKDGKIIVSTYNNKNYILNPTTATFTPYTAIDYAISAYVIDHNGSEWFGLNKDGITIDGKRYNTNDKQTNLPSNHIRDMAIDKQGRVWVATWGGGLAYTTPKPGKAPLFKVILNNELNKSKVYSLSLSTSGNLYVATYNGLYIIDTNKKDFSEDNILNFNVENKQLPTDEITTIKAIGDDTLWMGTTGYGALKVTFNAEKKTISYVTIDHSNGLPNDNIISIAKGDGNNIWLGTEEGLALVDGTNLWAKSYMPSTNVFGNMVSSIGILELSNGTVLFATNDGVAIIDGNIKLETSKETSIPHISDILINGKSMFGEELIKQNPLGHQEMSVAHNQGNIRFLFSNLDYPTINYTLYEFYLEGIDKSWREPSKTNMAEYSHLSPGTYIFHVRAMNGNKWSKETTFQLTIRQPWYNTIWAWIVYIAAIATITIVLYRQWRRNFELKQHMDMEKKMTDFRINFFTSIAHEFRTPLAIIEGAVNKLDAIKRGEQVGSQRSTIQMVKRGTTRLLRLVNELMEFRKINTGNARLSLQQCDIIQIVRNVYDDFRTLAEQKRLNLSFTPFDKQFIAAFDSNKVETIVYNLLSNAIKYTPNKGDVKICIKHNEGNITISVSDSGPGISEQQKQSLFEPFMHGYVSNGGMGIGLYTAYNMAKLHHGTLEYLHTEVGATFMLTLPDNDEGYAADDFAQPAAIDNEARSNEKADEIINELQSEALNDEIVAIIEDDADMMAQLASELGTYFKLVKYNNGAEGFKGVMETKPAMVVCDVMLPDMDGYEIVGKLKKDPAFENTPVIMLTALDDVNHQIKGYKAGADDYMVKPCNYHLLLARAIQLITWSKARQAKYAAMPTESSDQAAPTKIVTSMADKNFKQDVDFYIAQHISDSDFNVEQLAALVQMGHTKFYGKMKELTGMSPNKYIMNERMRIAAELVLEGRMNISEIAYKVGFQDPSYFNKCFKKQFGSIPSKYGKQ